MTAGATHVIRHACHPHACHPPCSTQMLLMTIHWPSALSAHLQCVIDRLVLCFFMCPLEDATLGYSMIDSPESLKALQFAINRLQLKNLLPEGCDAGLHLGGQPGGAGHPRSGQGFHRDGLPD